MDFSNGVVERFFGTLKYEHRYRATIGDGNALAVEVNPFRHTYNTLRPHHALDERTPRAAYLAVEPCDWRVAFGGPATRLGGPDMTSKFTELAIDCADPNGLARFWWRSLATRCKTKTTELSQLASLWCLQARTALAQCHRR